MCHQCRSSPCSAGLLFKQLVGLNNQHSNGLVVCTVGWSGLGPGKKLLNKLAYPFCCAAPHPTPKHTHTIPPRTRCQHHAACMHAWCPLRPLTGACRCAANVTPRSQASLNPQTSPGWWVMVAASMSVVSSFSAVMCALGAAMQMTHSTHR